MSPKRKIGARELKMRLGAYIRAVREGETLIVTERGEAVAELRPLRRQPTGQDAHLSALAAAGVLARGSGKALPPFRPVAVAGPPISRTIVEDRADRI